MKYESPLPSLSPAGNDTSAMSGPSDANARSEERDLSALPKALHVRPLTVRSIDGKPAVFIAEIGGREVGRMSITVVPLVHDMEIQSGTLQRRIADALFFYASGKVKAAGFNEALVLVAQDNAPMQRYVESRAVPDEASRVYVMGVQ